MLFWLKPNRVLAGPAILCALGSFIFACHAQDAPATYPVRGVVLNSLTRRPIARALVDGQSEAVLTDNDGRFEINLAAGMGQITVRRPGYNLNGPMMVHPVKVGPNTPELTFYLVPQANITVHVTLSSGDAADDIRFFAYRKRINQGHGRWMQEGNFTTDSEGVFRMVNVDAPASYLLCSMPTHETTVPLASGMGSGMGSGKTTYGYPPVCYPGVTDLSTASPLAVSPGQQVEAEITLTRQPFYPVTILMPNRGQGQPAGISINDQSGLRIGFPARFNTQQGLAEANLPNGRYYAESRSNNGKTSAYGRIDFQVTGQPVVGLSMVVHPLSPIAVEIRRDFTPNTAVGILGPVNGGSANDANPGLNITLHPVDASIANMGGYNLQHPAGSTDNSYFEMGNVTPGSYWVQTFSFQGYVSSISSGGADLAREPLVVAPGGAAAPIEISVRNDGGQISATVNPNSMSNSSSGEGETSITFAYAIPQFPTTAQLSGSAARGTDHLMFGNLAPGTYRLVAFDKPEEIDMDDPQSMARITSQGQTVTVEAGATASVQLDVIQTAQSGGEGPTP